MNRRTTLTATVALTLGLFSAASQCLANAICVTNVAVTGVTNGTADIQFDLSWSNSWNLSWSDDGGVTTVTNWDAAWVFVKFRTASAASWRHVRLASTSHTVPPGTTLDVGSNGAGTNVGVFVRRDAQGAGSLVASGVRLRWDLAQNGLGGTADVNVSVHAIEMVFIPQGAFALGTGGQESSAFYRYPNSTAPFWVTNESAIACGSTAGRLYGPSVSVLSNAFPKGYGAFYCMKHEISQDQYASYLNHLGTWEAILRFPDYTGSYRYTISLASNKYVATAPDRACNYLSVLDMCNYLDWACLRPMTELEYEKACRGPLTPEPNEYAWGSTTISYLTSVNGTDGSGTETALPATANCHAVSVVSGPVRVGIFAVPGADRQKSGAGYYGVLDLIGNVAELAVASGSTGNTYIPNHGDGSTSALPEGWPSYLGFTYRGGSFGDSEMASSRGNTAGSSRDNHCGGRGVRSVQ